MKIPEGWPTPEMLTIGVNEMFRQFNLTETEGGVTEIFRAMLAAAPTPPKTEGEVSVTQEDANNYCRILSLLGMEEEGDPVAEVERLLSARPAQEDEPARPDNGGLRKAAEEALKMLDIIGLSIPPTPRGATVVENLRAALEGK